GSTVEVVFTDKEHWRVFDSSEIHAFVSGADVGGTFAEKADSHAVKRPQPEANRRSRGDRDVGADDRIGRRGADGHVCQVHLPALTSRAARGLAPDFCRDGLRWATLGNQVSYRAVCAEDHVVLPQRGTDAHGDGFLPLVLVQRTRYEALEEQL